MKTPFLHQILTNPIAKTLLTNIVGALFFAADQAITTATGNSGNLGSNSALYLIGLTLAHNILSYERDRVFGETATPASVPKEVNAAAVQPIADNNPTTTLTTIGEKKWPTK